MVAIDKRKAIKKLVQNKLINIFFLKIRGTFAKIMFWKVADDKSQAMKYLRTSHSEDF